MYSKQPIYLYIVSVCIILLSLSCGKKKEKEKDIYSEVSSVTGSVNLLRDKEMESLVKGFAIKSGDIIMVGNNSMAVIALHKSRAIYLNENTKATIEYTMDEKNNELSFSVAMSYGEVFSDFLLSGEISIAYAVSTPTASIVGSGSSFKVSYYTKNNISIVKVFTEQVSIFPMNRKCFDVHACQKVLLKNDGSVSRLVSLDDDDMDELAEWVGKDKGASITSVSGCMEEQEVEENLPPVWESKPKSVCKPGKPFIDQLSAKDPEGAQVRYILVSAPKGMSISETGGVIHYNPQSPGTFEVRVSVGDEEGNASELSYYLTVIGKLNAVLKMPQSIKINTIYKIDASRSVDGYGKNEGLLFRFDVENDGVWDWPSSGDFGKQSFVKHSYEQPGTYTVKVEVKDKDGEITVKLKQLDVIAPLGLQISYDPQFGTVGTEYTLSVKHATGKSALPENLSIRWDLNGDNRWDYPSDGSFTYEMTIKHMWDKHGTYQVVAEVEDNGKNRTATSTEIVVFKGVTIESLKGPDTVFVNKKSTYTCAAKDPDFEIVEYEWGSAGIGMLGEKLKEPSTEISYKNAGTYTLICSAINEKGMSAAESKNIVVLSYSTLVNAGGPYKTSVNVPLTVNGSAQDIDNKIVSYFWDFNNDKKNDWSSKKSSKTEYTFDKKGSYVIRFSVKTDDGVITEDTALVSVGNNPPQAIAGEDILSRKNKKLKLNGIGKDPDGNIVKYEWDFNNDGHFDWHSDDTGYTEHSFREYSSAVFKVTDSEGAFSMDTVTIIICPKGMKLIKEGNYCIDIYEWPNEKGKTPRVNITYKEAKTECNKMEKRLCSAKEIETACKGGKGKYAYPYGRKYEADNCNTFGNRHTDNQIAKSGEFPNCQSRYGVFDMSGNVAEWTVTNKGKLHYVVGGWWQDDEDKAKCSSFKLLNKNKKYMYVGFRCCK